MLPSNASSPRGLGGDASIGSGGEEGGDLQQVVPLLNGAAPSPTSSDRLGGAPFEHKPFCSPLRLRLALLAYVAGVLVAATVVLPALLQSRTSGSNGGPIMVGGVALRPLVDTFPGAPWRTEQTVSSELLLSDKRMRVESHVVRGEDGTLLKDWIWMDVVDQVNVIPFVFAAAPTEPSALARWNPWRHGEFLVFRQKKYGLTAESLAVAGGQVEMAKQEAPLAAAQRELAEEMFLQSAEDAAAEGTGWVDLGSYRVNVNRGHGTVSCFLLLDARPVASASDAERSAEFKVDELERQRTVRFTLEQMEDAVSTHQFAEIKWQATAAMALQEVKRRAEEEDRRIEQRTGKGQLQLQQQTESDDEPDGSDSDSDGSRLAALEAAHAAHTSRPQTQLRHERMPPRGLGVPARRSAPLAATHESHAPSTRGRARPPHSTAEAAKLRAAEHASLHPARP